MLALEQVKKMISDLQEYVLANNVSINEIREKNQSLFYSIFEENEFYFISSDVNCTEDQLDKKNFLPYIASVNKNSNIPYLRIFSHKEIAINFMKDLGLPAKCCVALTPEESMQLAKYWLLRGVYGYMLNDGDTWITISFCDYLSVIFDRLFENSGMCNFEYVSWVNLLVLLDNEDGFSLMEGHKTIDLYSDPIGRVQIAELLERKDSANTINVDHELLCCRGSMDSFVRVYNEYYQKESIKESDSFNFKDIMYVNLDFTKEEDLPVVSKSTEENVEDLTLSSPQSKSEGSLRKIADYCKNKFKKERNTHGEKNQLSEERNTAERFVVEVPVCTKTKKRKNTKMVTLGITLTSLFLLTTFSLSFIVKSHSKEFASYLDQGLFFQAEKLYSENTEDPSFISEANEVIKNKVDKILSDYALNVIDANTAGAQLAEYKIFSDLQLYLNDALDYASQLEKSKNSFVVGNQAFRDGQYLQCLECWSDVIEKDINYNVVKKIIDEKKDSFISNGLLECSLYLKNNDVSHYQAGVILMHQWFPLDKNIEQAYQEVGAGIDFGNTTAEQKGNKELLTLFDNSLVTNASSESLKKQTESDTPIQISKFNVSFPKANGAINLMIDWINTSNKVIKNISFLVQAKDEFGREGKCYKREYSMYQAIASDVWEPGNGMNSERIYWKDVWYNSMIRSVDLLQVDITYSDGSTESITKQEDLKKLFK